MHEDEARDQETREHEDEGSGGKPPSPDGFVNSKEGGRGKGEEEHHGEDDEAQDAVEGTEEEDDQSQPGLQQDGVRRGSEARMEAPEGGQKSAGPRHGKADSRSGHTKRGNSSTDTYQHAD